MKTPKLYETNQYGVKIVKCCASCKKRVLDNRIRICMAGEGGVPASYLCNNWVMNPNLEKAGKGDGKVKKYDYLLYVLKQFEDDEAKAIAASTARLFYKRKSLADIREEYMKHHDTIYEIVK